MIGREFRRRQVAPFAGAWIETAEKENCAFKYPSLPSRERGLKLASQLHPPFLLLSLPSRERGLKQVLFNLIYSFGHVAPFAGAWIETTSPISSYTMFSVAPFAGAWIETGT